MESHGLKLPFPFLYIYWKEKKKHNKDMVGYIKTFKGTTLIIKMFFYIWRNQFFAPGRAIAVFKLWDLK